MTRIKVLVSDALELLDYASQTKSFFRNEIILLKGKDVFIDTSVFICRAELRIPISRPIPFSNPNTNHLLTISQQRQWQEKRHQRGINRA